MVLRITELSTLGGWVAGFIDQFSVVVFLSKHMDMKSCASSQTSPKYGPFIWN